MDVIVACAVNQEEFPSQFCGVGYGGTCLVAFGIILRSAHVPFGVDIGVESPVRHRRNGYGHFEIIGTVQDDHAGKITAVTPPPYTDPVLVDIGKRSKILRRFDLIVDLPLSEVFVTKGSERLSPKSCPSIVNHEYNVSLVR